MGDLPKGVGPHEGIEFALMRDGHKHIAYFTDIRPEGLDDMLRQGFHLIQWCHTVQAGTAWFCWIVYRTGHDAGALHLQQLIQHPIKGFDQAIEYEIGRLLSYDPRDIDAYLAHVGRLH